VNDCASEVQQQFVNVRAILSDERMLRKDYEKDISGRGSEGAWRQDELICGKPLVVK
jgi:hypothetical protein